MINLPEIYQKAKDVWLIGAGKFYQTFPSLGRAATGDHADAKISLELDQLF